MTHILEEVLSDHIIHTFGILFWQLLKKEKVIWINMNGYEFSVVFKIWSTPNRISAKLNYEFITIDYIIPPQNVKYRP